MSEPLGGGRSGDQDGRHAFACHALQRSALFRDLPTNRLDEVAASLQTGHHPRGRIIFSQGDPGDAMYLVEAGSVKITAESIDGREAIIGVVGPGETFGELVLVDAAPRSATATAMVDTVTLRLTRSTFTSLIEADPLFRQGVFIALSHELRRATGYLGELHFLDLCGRIAARLAQMAHERSTPEGTEIRLAGTHSQSELAAMVGGSRQRVNAHLGELVDGGMIRLEGREIVVVDLDALKRRGQW